MTETLRACFYTGRWSVKECQPGSIFLSQGDYPIKGAHVMLNAMPDILKQRPDAHLYVAGNNITSYHSLKDKIKISSYGKYLHDLIVQHNLTGKVTILGRLTAEEMKQQFLKSSVFVCPSLIENSPNALGEAMLLGVPCVAAATGGIPDILADGRVGRLFSSGNSAELAQAVVRIWNDDNIAQLSARAMARAAVIHNRDTNYNRLMELYHEINLHF
jgi:glycosyltransferase involved in cell wall biosynthesis